MQKILILLIILLTGCQTTTQNPNDQLNKKNVAAKQSNSKNKAAIYNRYTRTNDRYTQKQDGAPVKAQTISFKEPIPSKEPLSRYGNPVAYNVAGRTYEVMRNSHGYKSKGIASWYGTKFHQQRTSSGEPYNMYYMTAAHRTLPIPSYVKVRNLKNGKEAVVKINDRGPFHSNRLIDLSYAAALKLGVYPHGTAPVEIESLMAPASTAHYYLQAGAFSSESLAKQLKAKVAHITPSPVSIERFQKRYIVRVGPFKAKQLADQLKTKLAHNGVRGAFSVLI